MWRILKKWWPVGKALLGVAVIVAVGWQFARILNDPTLREQAPDRSPLEVLTGALLAARPGWLLAAAVCYAVGLGFSAFFWHRLLRLLGQRPSPTATAWAYYVGHLAKYVPGKAWSLFARSSLATGPETRLGVSALTAVYETLTTMAAGALLAAALLPWLAADGGDRLWYALGLLALAGVPILPGVFNPVVRRLAAPFLKAETQPIPPVRTSTLLSGLGLTACGWLLLGASFWAVLQAVRPQPFDPTVLARCIAYLAVAYVAGFIIPTGGGLGTRELILQQFLEPQLGKLDSVVAVLLLRLLWMATEVLMAGVTTVPILAAWRRSPSPDLLQPTPGPTP
jgi:glycosyltransferase 2 family protein